MTETLARFLGARGAVSVTEGGERFTVKLLSARALLEAGREAAELARFPEEAGLCRNAAVLARALFRGEAPAFPSAEAVLEALTAEQIARLTAAFAALGREENPSAEGPMEEVDALKKAWSTRPTSA
jgi:hypothetical protein